MARLAVTCALVLAASSSASAQASVKRLAAGRVMRPSAKGAPVPVAGQWIVLHRVGTDQASPVDSAKSAADGRFRISYTPFGAPDALYFVSSRYGGIAYFSPPLRADTVRGGDADVMVYDTTPDTSTLHVQGRHFVMSMARGTRREIAEVYELDNDGTHTIVAADTTSPIWTTHLPAEAESVTVAPGDIGAGAVVFKRGRAELFAPISPGVRQLVITYQLSDKAFPLSHPLERPVSVLEVLLEDPRALVEGAKLAEVPLATVGGRSFRRYLAQDVPGSAVIRVTPPPPIARNQTAMKVLAVVLGLAMLGAFGLWYARRRNTVTSAFPMRRVAMSDGLIAELAALDAAFDRSDPTPETRATYERARGELKARIARALAAEGQPA